MIGRFQNGRWRRLLTHPIAAAVVALVIVALQSLPKPDRPIYADEFEYLTASANLALHGTFSQDPPLAAAPPRPGAYFSPLAPALYAALMRADDSLRQSLLCQLGHPGAPQAHCTISYGWRFRAVMVLLAATGLWGSFLLARALALSAAAAWVALAVVAAAGSHAYYVRYFLTEGPLLAVFPFFLLLLTRGCTGNSRRALVALGMAMGVLALARPSYAYQAYAVILALPWLRCLRRREAVSWGDTRAAGWAMIGYAVAVLPWMARNYVQVGQFALTSGYDTFILVQRLLYNGMSWAEWGMSWVYWLPDFGDDLGARLFGLDAVHKLSLIEPDGYHGAGHPVVPLEMKRQPDGSPADLPYLFVTQVLAHPVKHVLVTLALAWQGLWAGKYVTLVALALAPPAMARMKRDGWLVDFLTIAAPVLFMVGFNAFVSVSLPRYNLPLLWVDGLVAAAFVERLMRARGENDGREDIA